MSNSKTSNSMIRETAPAWAAQTRTEVDRDAGGNVLGVVYVSRTRRVGRFEVELRRADEPALRGGLKVAEPARIWIGYQHITPAQARQLAAILTELADSAAQGQS